MSTKKVGVKKIFTVIMKRQRCHVYSKGVVIDIQTNGNGLDETNFWQPYAEHLMPLPCPNYPINITMCMFDNYKVFTQKTWIIKGATRFDPWVAENVVSASVEECNEKGHDFFKVVQEMKQMMHHTPHCIVCHNIVYHMDQIFYKFFENHTNSEEFLFFTKCPTFCTMVNAYTKSSSMVHPLAYYHPRFRQWFGPSMESLAKYLGVPFELLLAHSSTYRVSVTYKCYLKIVSN